MLLIQFLGVVRVRRGGRRVQPPGRRALVVMLALRTPGGSPLRAVAVVWSWSVDESAGRLPTLGGSRPADCCRWRIDLAVNGNHSLTRVARCGQRTLLLLSSRPPDGDGSGGSNRPAFWADRRFRSRNRSLGKNSISFFAAVFGHTHDEAGGNRPR